MIVLFINIIAGLISQFSWPFIQVASVVIWKCQAWCMPERPYDQAEFYTLYTSIKATFSKHWKKNGAKMAPPWSCFRKRPHSSKVEPFFP